MFSIITPMYKGAELVAQTIESVLAQTEKDWEMIIVDDCSPDEGAGAAVVEKYSHKDNRVKLIRSPTNRGSSGARNLAMENADGTYFAFLDSDDIWDRDYLEKMKKHIDENKDENAAVYFCGYRRKDSKCEKEILPPYVKTGKFNFKKLLFHCPIFPSTAVLDTQKLREKVTFREELRNLRDDYAFWLDIMKQGLTAVGYEDILVDYRMRSDSLTASKMKMIYPQWNIYRNVLKMNILQSAFYLFSWAFNGVFKYKAISKKFNS
jgi:glycosyltransferase involved in cell wall biosynthesis